MWGCRADSTPCSVSDNQLERKQPMCFFSTSLPSRAARLRFYARKDLRKGWTWRNAQCQAEGPEQAPVIRAKMRSYFWRRFLPARPHHLFFPVWDRAGVAGARVASKTKRLSETGSRLLYVSRFATENEVKYLAWTIGTFSCKQFSLVKLFFDRLQIQRETVLPVDPRIFFSKLARCTRWGPLNWRYPYTIISTLTSWWFQPIPKRLVKMGIFPK